ncbi:MAG: carbohydrate binding family 9 domain-containing protein, partial [Bacteroidetes bacterium]|nr:carbohydrate binding family 9 domain-containing protein [Bacteroidota bacterium]
MRYYFFKPTFIIIYVIILFSFKIIAQNKIIYAAKTPVPPVIDGILNDSVWNIAKPISDFLQQEPIAGKTPSQKTEVRILYDDKNIYVSFMCYDTDPKKIVARALKLDGAWGADDNISLIFDTFNDKRSGYWFGTNPLGMRDDALLNGSGFGGFNEQWHGIWDVRSAIVDSGWSTELTFPFSTFKFYNKPVQTWGIEFTRSIARNGETIRWSTVGKDIQFFDLSKQGKLLGIKGIKRGNPVYLKPFITAGTEKGETRNSTLHEVGLDIKYGLTQSLSLDLTFNTDFAQVESDRAVINLSRFPFFFPEQREFFLEGANIFSFGFGGRDNIFYSRRIGISDENEISIIAGAKLVGRTNNMELGILEIQTSAEKGEPGTNYGIARVKFDIFDQSYVGIFFSNKLSFNDFNRSVGADILLRISKFLNDKNLAFGLRVAKTDEKHGGKNSWAGRMFIDYSNDLIDQFMSYGFIQQKFNPGIGFIS